MVRLILAALAGLLVGVLVIGVIEGVGHTLFPPPADVNLTDPAQMKTVMSQVPMEAKVAVLLGWFLGALAGASTANLIAGRRRLAGWITAAALLAFAVWTMLTIAHPVWFMICAVLANLAAAALATLAFGRPRPISPPSA